MPDRRKLPNRRVTETIEITAHEAAVSASLALQHGAPLESLHAALLKLPNGKSAGPLGHALDLLRSELKQDCARPIRGSRAT